MLKIDVHEDKKVLKAFDKKEIEYVVEGLPIGDIVYNNICIERKTVGDFYGSVMSQRIFHQSLNMKKNYKHCFVIIVGNYKELFYNKYIKKVNINIFLGAMASLVTRYDMKVLCCNSNADMVYLIKKIISKLDDGTSPDEVMRISRNDAETVKTSMLACIPGISVVKADTLLEKFDFYLKFSPKTPEITKITQLKGFGQKICSEVKKYATIKSRISKD